MTYLPTSAEEVAAVLKERAAPIRISYDNDESAIDSLSLYTLQTITLYEPEEMVVSLQAGIPLTELERVLAEKGQWIPTLVAAENPYTTLGAAIVNDQYHPRAASMGMLRTSILGGTFCTTNGELFKSGSRVVKSVAGYDIHRAFCGSKGLFGAIISVTLKVQPKPEAFFRFTTSTENSRAMLRYLPTITETLNNTLIVELAGYKEDIEEGSRLLHEADLIDKKLSNKEWIEMVLQIRENKTSIKTNTELLTKVRQVFDPKGILLP